ncbi:putative S-layer protein [archaeon]|nr:putative S-layer protein [archaeon]
MKKTLTIFAASVFAIVMFLSLASADMTNVTVTGFPSSKLDQVNGSFVLTFNNTNDTARTVNLTIPSIGEGDADSMIIFSIEGSETSKNILIGPESNETVTVNYNIGENFNFDLGTVYSTKYFLDGTEKGTLTFKDTEFCEYGNKDNNLEIYKFDIKNLGDGDDNTWELLDDIEISVEVKNKDDESISDVEVQIKIINEEGEDVTNDFTDDDVYDIGKIYYSERDTATFDLNVNPKDIEEGYYKIYVKVYEDGNEEENCDYVDTDLSTNDRYYEVEVKENSNEVKITNLEMPETSECEEFVTVYFDLYNFIADNEDMRVNLYSSQLGIDEYSEIFNLDKGDYESLDFQFKVPSDLSEKTYEIKIITEYNYREKEDYFKSETGDAGSLSLVVSGNCKIIKPSVSAELTTEAKVGQEMIVTGLITNLENKAVTYTISAEGHESWAKLTEVKPEVMSLAQGETKEVSFKFIPNKESEGDEKFTFNMVISSQGKIITTQPVAVTVEAGSINFKDLLTKERLQIAGIILLNLLLVVSIIIVARKILRKK